MSTQYPAYPKSAASPLTQSLKRDLKTLDKHGAVPGTPMSPLAKLSVAQLWEVERMAAQGMSLGQIGVRLMIPEDIWSQYIQMNPDLNEAFQAGAMRGIDVASASIFKAVESGDVPASRYYLDRLGGPQFRPQPAAPAVVVQTGAVVNIDPSSVSEAMERQRKLLDGEFEELDGSD